MPPMEEYFREIAPLWDSFHITNNGALHNQLQDKLNIYLRVKNTVLFCNGHQALSCVIQAMGLSGEVITSPFTFASTTHAIVENGLVPIFCDIHESDLTIDPHKIEELITNKTSAIIAVHVYGHLCDFDAIASIAKKYNLKVIYDAAHAFGVSKNQKGAGSFGDASMFSFHATKLFHSIEGGCVTFSDENLIEKLERLKNFGIHSKKNEDIGFGKNAKMNEFAAAMGLCNLRHIDTYIESRRRLVDMYRDLLSDLQVIKLFEPQENVEHNYNYMPIIITKNKFGINRDQVVQALEEANIFPRKYFYPLTSDFECYRNLYHSDTPIARSVAENILCLPLYSDLEVDSVETTCKIIRALCQRSVS